LNIDSIRNGIVIDHIQAKKGLEIYDALKLGELDCSVAIITNAKSKKMGKKDIIKIDKNIDLDLNILGYMDPNITINIIKDDERVEKFHVELPEQIVNIIKCKNPRCITSAEQELNHIFVLTDKDTKSYRCKYCETLGKGYNVHN
jgi:aspartate carbamoyltransferase regulatory subunit